MTPEQKAVLQQLLSGGASGPVHADADLDYEQICQVIEEKLAPAFGIIGTELKSLREENAELKDIVYKMVTSFSDAVGAHKRSGLQQTIMGKYGPDLESLGPVYSDFRGGDIVNDLLDALQGEDGDHEALAGQFIEQAKAKFGKYLGPKSSVEIEVEAKPEDKQGELGLEEAPVEEEEKEEEAGPTDSVSKMMMAVKSLRGQKRKTA